MTAEAMLHSANLPHVEREIHGRPYRVDRLGWWDVQDAIDALADVLGPSISQALDGHGLDSIMEDPSVPWGTAIVGALQRAARKGGRGRQLLETLGRQTMITDDADGEAEPRRLRLTKAVMDVWFSRYPGDAIPWLLFALEVQVADFFGPFLARLPTARNSSGSERTQTEAAAPGWAQPSQSTS